MTLETYHRLGIPVQVLANFVHAKRFKMYIGLGFNSTFVLYRERDTNGSIYIDDQYSGEKTTSSSSSSGYSFSPQLIHSLGLEVNLGERISLRNTYNCTHAILPRTWESGHLGNRAFKQFDYFIGAGFGVYYNFK